MHPVRKSSKEWVSEANCARSALTYPLNGWTIANMPQPPVKRVAGEVRAEMARQGVTQAQLAAAINLSQSTLSRRLNGDRSFTLTDLLAIATFLGRPLIQFTGVADAETGPEWAINGDGRPIRIGQTLDPEGVAS
jgi:DNA-binding XRE family transcriptional regulator